MLSTNSSGLGADEAGGVATAAGAGGVTTEEGFGTGSSVGTDATPDSGAAGGGTTGTGSGSGGRESVVDGGFKTSSAIRINPRI